MTQTILGKTCTNNGTWVQLTRSVSALAGHRLTLRLISHDDNFPGDPTYALFDDIIAR